MGLGLVGWGPVAWGWWHAGRICTWASAPQRLNFTVAVIGGGGVVDGCWFGGLALLQGAAACPGGATSGALLLLRLPPTLLPLRSWPTTTR